MANYCDYTMKVKGKKENCLKFKDKMDDYTEPKHFWRIFNCDIDEEGDDYIILVGDCAWSIESCCRATGYSNGFDLFAENTKDLDLELEVWSSETDGIFFEEHYIYKKGECIEEDCISTEALYCYPNWDKGEFPTFAEFLDEYGLDPEEISEEDYNINGQYIANSDNGGFPDFGDWHI